MIGALAYPTFGGRSPRAFFATHLGAVRSREIVRFLKHLRRHIRGPVVLFWDGLHAHRSRETRAYLETQRFWLTVHRLPAYAPELNPVEGMWAWCKGASGAANLCVDTLAPLRHQLHLGRRRLRRSPDRLWGFLRKAGLFI